MQYTWKQRLWAYSMPRNTRTCFIKCRCVGTPRPLCKARVACYAIKKQCIDKDFYNRVERCWQNIGLVPWIDSRSIHLGNYLLSGFPFVVISTANATATRLLLLCTITSGRSRVRHEHWGTEAVWFISVVFCKRSTVKKQQQCIIPPECLFPLLTYGFVKSMINCILNNLKSSCKPFCGC